MATYNSNYTGQQIDSAVETALTIPASTGQTDKVLVHQSSGNSWQKVTISNMSSGSATDGQIPTADGAGGLTWEDIEIDETNIASESTDSGKVLTADGSGGTVWQYPSASNMSSGSATSGQVLTANGSGGATWEDASGGSNLYYHKITNTYSGNTTYLHVITNTSVPINTDSLFNSLVRNLQSAGSLAKLKSDGMFIMGVKTGSDGLIISFSTSSDDYTITQAQFSSSGSITTVSTTYYAAGVFADTVTAL